MRKPYPFLYLCPDTWLLPILFSVALFAAGSGHAAKPKSSLAYQYYSKGVELNSKKKWDDALKQFQSAIDLNPSFVTAYIEFARTSVMVGKRSQGLEHLDSALLVARTREDRDRVQKERESLSEIFYTNETFQTYQDGLNSMKLDHAAKAAEYLERAMRTEPDNILVLSAYARALRQEDRAKDAVSVLKRALKLNDSKRDVRLELAEAVLSADPESAHELLHGLPVGLTDERATLLDAQALAALNRNGEAIELVRGLYDRVPGSLYAPYWLGKLYEKESNGAWNARRYLMTFIRRAEPQVTAQKDENTAESRQLKAARAEADQILARVNRSLE
jgi:thioredoxin-like negative regulator of GroEL